MRFVTHPAPAAVAGAVREMWLLDDDGAFHAGLPKPQVELVVSLAGIHWWRAAPDAPEHRYDHSWLTPVQDGPRYARAEGRRILVGARLEPWAARALVGPLPPGDGAPPRRLKALIGGEADRLRATLLAAESDADRFARLGDWLQAQGALRATAPPFVDEASAKALARALQVKERALRRRFAREAGLSPKRWLLLRRLDAVLRDPALLDPSAPLAEVALAHGFADQAHLSRQVARLTGATPGALRRRAPGLPPHLNPGG